MANTNVPFSGLPIAQTLTGAEVLPVDQGGTTVQATIASIANLVSSGLHAVGNPTALVGLTAVNGSTITAMRRDGAPALDQSIAPTWTGVHTFSASAQFNSAVAFSTNVTISDLSVSSAVTISASLAANSLAISSAITAQSITASSLITGLSLSISSAVNATSISISSNAFFTTFIASSTVFSPVLSISSNAFINNLTVASTYSMPAGGATGVGCKFSAASNYGIFFGSGAPLITAAQGSLYLRSDGASSVSRAYINTAGTSVWTAVLTVI